MSSLAAFLLGAGATVVLAILAGIGFTLWLVRGGREIGPW